MFICSMSSVHQMFIYSFIRKKIVKENALPEIENYMFEEHEQIRQAATECMCNLVTCKEVRIYIFSYNWRFWQTVWIVRSRLAIFILNLQYKNLFQYHNEIFNILVVVLQWKGKLCRSMLYVVMNQYRCCGAASKLCLDVSWQVQERYMQDGNDRLKLLVLLCSEDDDKLQRAASGALAMLTATHKKLCTKITQVVRTLMPRLSQTSFSYQYVYCDFV